MTQINHWMIGGCLVLVSSSLVLGCTRSFPHAYDPKVARDYMTEPAYSGRSEPRSKLAVLLVPENTTVYKPVHQGSPWFSWDRELPQYEHYDGPARIFLTPARHYYVGTLKTSEGFIELDLELDLLAGTAYELVIDEAEENLNWELVRLHPSTYSRLHPSK